MNNPKFNSLLERMKEIHDKKNSDYANDLDPYSNFSFAASFSGTTKLQVYLTLIGVKAARLLELLNKDKTPKNESINDTLLDFAVYATIMCSNLSVEEKDNPNICTICKELLDDDCFIGVGDGRGQKFAHFNCYTQTVEQQ